MNRVAAGVLAAWLCVVAEAQPALTLRSFGATPAPVTAGEVSAVNADGVTVVTARAADGRVVDSVLWGWHQVKSVGGAFASAAAPLASRGDEAWRGLSRLERGDVVAAEPVLERMFTEYQTRTGPTACAIDAGLARCRISRGALTAAVVPWLAWRRAQAVATPPRFDRAEAVWGDLLDPASGLVPGLPPIFPDTPATRALARAGLGEASPGASVPDDLARTLARLYAVAAQFESGTPGVAPDPRTADLGVRLVFDVVRARVGDDATRADARKSLAERVKPNAPALGTWQESWVRVGLGRSLVREADPELKRQGVLQLLELPARNRSTDSYLTGVALADAAAALEALGDHAGATVLARELIDRYPDHPALDAPSLRPWESLRRASLPQGADPVAPDKTDKKEDSPS